MFIKESKIKGLSWAAKSKCKKTNMVYLEGKHLILVRNEWIRLEEYKDCLVEKFQEVLDMASEIDFTEGIYDELIEDKEFMYEVAIGSILDTGLYLLPFYDYMIISEEDKVQFDFLFDFGRVFRIVDDFKVEEVFLEDCERAYKIDKNIKKHMRKELEKTGIDYIEEFSAESAKYELEMTRGWSSKRIIQEFEMSLEDDFDLEEDNFDEDEEELVYYFSEDDIDEELFDIEY
ncbi:hypothetical protein NHG29_09175 [Aerococcaceae bacterium NML160702]|nr:hypothetical protein [Aerococcaceae bacterium NML160702]